MVAFVEVVSGAPGAAEPKENARSLTTTTATVTRPHADRRAGSLRPATERLEPHGRRLGALADAVARYEAEDGEITEDELAEQARADRDAAAAVRAGRRRSRGAA